MNKKGLSDIIVIVLFILVALAAVLIIWSFIRINLNRLDSANDLQFLTSSYTIPKQSVSIDPENSNIKFAINRESGNDKTAGFLITLKDSNGLYREFRVNGSVESFNSLNINQNYGSLGLINVTEIVVLPIFLNDRNEEVRGRTTFELKLIGEPKTHSTPDTDPDPDPVCTPNWQFGAWSTCAAGQQTRTATDLNNCGDLTGKPADQTQSCTVTCTYTYSAWSACTSNQQTRVLLTTSPSGCSGTPEPLVKGCGMNYNASASWNHFYGSHYLHYINDSNTGTGVIFHYLNDVGAPYPKQSYLYNDTINLTMTFESPVKITKIAVDAGQYNGPYNKPVELKLYLGTNVDLSKPPIWKIVGPTIPWALTEFNVVNTEYGKTYTLIINKSGTYHTSLQEIQVYDD